MTPIIQPNAIQPSIGASALTYVEAKSILTKPAGYADFFDYSLNPYSGCTFGCSYCYAAYFARSDDLKQTWGQWVHVKENALDLLKRRRKKPLTGKTIYMSTVTDPYQPVEKDLELTRALLEELYTHHQPRLVVQTRSPLVTRDIDLFQQFDHIQVNMTVTTDDDSIRKQFEPRCSSIDQRLDAITRVHEAGIPTAITMTPLLPVRDPRRFAGRLLETGVPHFAIQPFHPANMRFMSSTPQHVQTLTKKMGWNFARYDEVYQILRDALPSMIEGKQGFIPKWKS